MLALHVVLSFIALLVGARVLIGLGAGRRESAWSAALLVSTALVTLTGFVLPSPPGTPTPDPARIVGVVELVVVLIAALARAKQGLYVVGIVLAVYLNAFVAVTQAFQKIGFLHVLAPTGKEPPFLIAQLLILALFIAVGVVAFRHRAVRAVDAVI